ncbi:DUF938 domain-containing protein [soil metagenome]
MEDVRRFAPATQRNRAPILAFLKGVLARTPSSPRVVEIASGTGEHAAYFARELDVASYQPTDGDASSCASIDAWVEHEKATRALPAITLDVETSPWPITQADVVLCINMIHISPWSACLALLDGAASVLTEGGPLVLYGPYRVGGAHTAPSNAEFDRSLRDRDPRWGVRDLEAVIDEAKSRGLRHEETVTMPANNFGVAFRRAAKTG